MDIFYLLAKLLFIIILPTMSIVGTMLITGSSLHLSLIMQWFIFWGLGIGHVLAGIKQSYNPAFTAHKIFGITNNDCFPIIRELGFANISIGLLAIISLFIPSWRLPAACAGCTFLGLAALLHIIKKPTTPNEWLALFFDIFMACFLATFIAYSLSAP